MSGKPSTAMFLVLLKTVDLGFITWCTWSVHKSAVETLDDGFGKLWEHRWISFRENVWEVAYPRPSWLLQWPFLSCSKPLFQSEAWCKTIDMKMIFNSHANKTRFHKKGFHLASIWKWEFPELGNGLKLSNSKASILREETSRACGSCKSFVIRS